MHPLPPQVAVDPADPDSYAAEQILSTLAENRKWLNEMEETSNISMRIFEYSALIFLVMLLKFVTENTRDIYVRLTSPCPSPLRPSSPVDSPVMSPQPTSGQVIAMGAEECEDDDPLDSPPARGPIARYMPRFRRPSVDSPKMDLEGIDFYFQSPPLTPLRSAVGRFARERHLSETGSGAPSPGRVASCESSGSLRGKAAADEAKRLVDEISRESSAAQSPMDVEDHHEDTEVQKAELADSEADLSRRIASARRDTFARRSSSRSRGSRKHSPDVSLRRAQRPAPIAVSESTRRLRLSTAAAQLVVRGTRRAMPEPISRFSSWQHSTYYWMLERDRAANLELTSHTAPGFERLSSRGNTKRQGGYRVDTIMPERKARRPAAGAAGCADWLSKDPEGSIAQRLLNRDARILNNVLTSPEFMAKMPSGDSKGGDSNMDSVKARDWNRMWEKTQSLQTEASQIREECEALRSELRLQISASVELEETNECLKGDLTSLLNENGKLRHLNIGLRDLVAEERKTSTELSNTISRSLSGERDSGHGALHTYVSNYMQFNAELTVLRHENSQLRSRLSRARDLRDRKRAEEAQELDALKASRLSGEPSGADLKIVLDMAFDAAGNAGSQERHNFNLAIAEDLSMASGVPTKNFRIIDVQAGSVCVMTSILQDSDCPSALSIARDLEKQSVDPHSQLRQGRLTSEIKEIVLMPSAKKDFSEVEALRKSNLTLAHEVESLKRRAFIQIENPTDLRDRELEIESLKDSLAATKASSDALQTEVEVYKKESEMNRPLLEQARVNAEALVALKQDAESMSSRLDHYMTLKQEHDALNERFDQYMKDSAASRAFLETEKDNLWEENAALKNEQKEFTQLAEENAALKDEIETYQIAAVKLEAELERVKDQQEASELEVHRLYDEVASLEKNKSGLESNLHAAVATVEETSSAQKVAWEGLVNEKRALRDQLEALESQKARLEEELKAATVKEREAVAECAKLQAQHHKALEETEGIRITVANLAADKIDLDSQLKHALSAGEQARGQIEELQCDLQSSSAANAELARELAKKAETEKDSISHYTEKITRLQNDLENSQSLESELMMTKKLMEETSRTHDAMRLKFAGEIEHLQRALGHKTDELANLQDKYASKDREVRELQIDVEERKSELERIASDLVQERTRCQEMQDRTDQLVKKEIDGNLAEQQRAEQEYQRAARLEEELGVERERHVQTQKLLHELGLQSEMAAEAVVQLKEALSQKELEVKKLLAGADDRLKELDDRVLVHESLQQKLTEVATDRQQLREAIAKQQAEQDALHARFEMVQSNNEHASTSFQQMQATLDSSRRQISELEEKLEQKEGVERELSSKVSALEQSLRRRESTEKELEQKLERLQGDLEREKLHTQASRDQWNSASGERESALSEVTKMRDALAEKLAEANTERDAFADELASANAECERLQAKVLVLGEHSKANIMTIRDLETKLFAVQELHETRPLPNTPPDFGLPLSNQALDALEGELLKEALRSPARAVSPDSGGPASLYASSNRASQHLHQTSPAVSSKVAVQRRAAPPPQRSVLPPHTSTVEPGYLGIKLSSDHRVEGISDLADKNGAAQGAPTYLNEAVGVGDVLVSIDGEETSGKSLQDVHHLLAGHLGSIVALRFRRGTGLEYDVEVMRHEFHRFDASRQPQGGTTGVSSSGGGGNGILGDLFRATTRDVGAEHQGTGADTTNQDSKSSAGSVAFPTARSTFRDPPEAVVDARAASATSASAWMMMGMGHAGIVTTDGSQPHKGPPEPGGLTAPPSVVESSDTSPAGHASLPAQASTSQMQVQPPINGAIVLDGTSRQEQDSGIA